MFLNYRFQALEEGPGRPAFSPRASLIIPSGRPEDGAGEAGLQINLPVSKQHGDFHFNANGGFTWLPRGERADLTSPSLAGSVIYRVRPMFNLMLESVVTFAAADNAEGIVERARLFTISPGVRGGWNVAEDSQVILGFAVPVTFASGESSAGVFLYFSYELPFKK